MAMLDLLIMGSLLVLVVVGLVTGRR